MDISEYQKIIEKLSSQNKRLHQIYERERKKVRKELEEVIEVTKTKNEKLESELTRVISETNQCKTSFKEKEEALTDFKARYENLNQDYKSSKEDVIRLNTKVNELNVKLKDTEHERDSHKKTAEQYESKFLEEAQAHKETRSKLEVTESKNKISSQVEEKTTIHREINAAKDLVDGQLWLYEKMKDIQRKTAEYEDLLDMLENKNKYEEKAEVSETVHATETETLEEFQTVKLEVKQTKMETTTAKGKNVGMKTTEQFVEVTNYSNEDLELDGWKIYQTAKDGKSVSFTFPKYLLKKKGEVKVYNKHSAPKNLGGNLVFTGNSWFPGTSDKKTGLQNKKGEELFGV